MNLNPFDIKAALMAKHAQHVVLIHFPIALFTTAVGFDFLFQWTRNRLLAVAAYFNLLVAAAFTLPVIATGLAAWQWALEGQRLKGILLQHLLLGCISTLLVWLVSGIHFQSRRKPDQELPGYRLFLEVFAVLLIGATAHLGGFLSGVNSAR
jgi:uncharacterized membrane protein